MGTKNLVLFAAAALVIIVIASLFGLSYPLPASQAHELGLLGGLTGAYLYWKYFEKSRLEKHYSERAEAKRKQKEGQTA